MTEQVPTPQEIEALARELHVTILGRDYMADHALAGRAARALSSLSQRLAEAEQRASEEYACYLHAVADGIAVSDRATAAEARLAEAERIYRTQKEEYALCRKLLVERAGEVTAAEARLAKCREYAGTLLALVFGDEAELRATRERGREALAALDASEPPHDGGETPNHSSSTKET